MFAPVRDWLARLATTRRVRSSSSQEIVGRADSTATQIYADAYDGSPQSREFYSFLKTMETYQSTVDTETWLLMSTDGEFYRYLTESKARNAP